MNEAPPAARRIEADAEAGIVEELFFEPDPKALRRMRSAATLFGALLVLLMVTVAYLIVSYDVPELGVVLILPVAGFLLLFAAIVWVNRANKGTAIRVAGDTLTLRDHTGRESSCALRQVRYNDTAIATRDMAVFLGRPTAGIYPRKVVKSELLPLLANATRVNPMTMTKILIELRHPQGIVTVLAGAVAVFIGIVMAAQRIGV